MISKNSKRGDMLLTLRRSSPEVAGTWTRSSSWAGARREQPKHDWEHEAVKSTLLPRRRGRREQQMRVSEGSGQARPHAP